MERGGVVNPRLQTLATHSHLSTLAASNPLYPRLLTFAPSPSASSPIPRSSCPSSPSRPPPPLTPCRPPSTARLLRGFRKPILAGHPRLRPLAALADGCRGRRRLRQADDSGGVQTPVGHQATVRKASIGKGPMRRQPFRNRGKHIHSAINNGHAPRETGKGSPHGPPPSVEIRKTSGPPGGRARDLMLAASGLLSRSVSRKARDPSCGAKPVPLEGRHHERLYYLATDGTELGGGVFPRSSHARQAIYSGASCGPTDNHAPASIRKITADPKALYGIVGFPIKGNAGCE